MIQEDLTMRDGLDGIVTVTRDQIEAAAWIVRHWGRGTSSNKIVSTVTFSERTEAVAFARRLQRNHGAGDQFVCHER